MFIKTPTCFFCFFLFAYCNFTEYWKTLLVTSSCIDKRQSRLQIKKVASSNPSTGFDKPSPWTSVLQEHCIMANLVLGACLPNKKYLIVLCICLYVATKGGHFVFLTHCCMILMDTSTHLCDHFASSTVNSEMCVIWHVEFSTPYLCVQDAHSIEQPVGEHEQERQHGQQGSENEDARHGGLGRPEKQRPHG